MVFNERDTQMKRKFHTPEQIIKKLREADAAVASGNTVEQVCRKLEISDATCGRTAILSRSTASCVMRFWIVKYFIQ